MKKLWDWAVDQFVKLKDTVIELFEEGMDKVLNFFELQTIVKVKYELKLI